MRYAVLLLLIVSIKSALGAEKLLKLKQGFVTKVACEGKLYLAALGDEGLVTMEPIPKDLGCAVILKPGKHSGMTNLVLETSAGTVLINVQVLR